MHPASPSDSLLVSQIGVWTAGMATLTAAGAWFSAYCAHQSRLDAREESKRQSARQERLAAQNRRLKLRNRQSKHRLEHSAHYWALKRIRPQYIEFPLEWYAQYWEHQELQWLDFKAGLIGRTTFRNWMKLRERDWQLNERLGALPYRNGFESVVPEHLTPRFCTFMRSVFRDGPEIALSQFAARRASVRARFNAHQHREGHPEHASPGRNQW